MHGQLCIDNVAISTDVVIHSPILVIMIYLLRLFQKYYHGESIAVNVLVDNNSNKSVKKVKISGKGQGPH